MPWNTTTNHYRKFLKAEGVYLNSGSPVKGLLRFWGEWEPDSKVNLLGSGTPTQEHEPFITIAKGRVVTPKCPYNNTDPFVFSDHFYYSLCQQYVIHPTPLRYLDKGSLILFGSHKHDASGPYFALDTVFVVGDYRDYTGANYLTTLAGFIPPHYDEIMDMSSYGPMQLRCYKGASYKAPFDGMYSFVPCKLASAPKFEQVRLTASVIPDLSVNQTQGKKFLHFTNIADIKKIWEDVREAVNKQGFLEGVEFNY